MNSAALVEGLAGIVAEEGGAPDRGDLQAVVALALEHAGGGGPQDLLPYEVMLIRLAKYVAAQLPSDVHRDRPRRRRIRDRISDLLVAQGLDPTGARVVPRR
ncbi:MAG: hypothetical protein KC933_17535 [Myxococcales bacterium]|nr:hypothetical protein [Myxococcales bacterium]MCB9649908.1 hypothetical protein [Deltaproteobacteria bacterium]